MDLTTGASRGELLEWINSTLKLNIQKIEETASGAVACQIIDMIFPDTIPLQRVNFMAKDAYEYSKNYKILQSAFLKNKIEKNIDVDRLIKGRPQDNLEFMQWLKKFYDQHIPIGEYNAEERRSLSKGAKELNHTHSTVQHKITRPPTQTRDILSPPHKKTKVLAAASTLSRRASEHDKEVDELRKQVTEKDGIIEKQKLEISNLESERDFYNKKLVDIDEYLIKLKQSEVSLQEVCDGIHSILYKEVQSSKE